MRKDIEIPKVENVHIVAVKEWDEDFSGKLWYVYVVNDRDDAIEAVLVMSRGKSDDRKTTTLRHNLNNIASKNSGKVEYIPDEVLGFTNEYLVTFFAENKLYEKKFVFDPNSISEEKVIALPVLELEGIKAT